MNYGGIETEYTIYDKAKFVIVPVPYDLTSTYQSGSRRGPGAILDASANMELYDEELRQETYRAGIHILPPLEVDARGPEEMMNSVHLTVAGVAADGKIPIVLGGEHSISFGAVRAMKEGAVDYLPKPFDLNDLEKLIQGFLQPPAWEKKDRTQDTSEAVAKLAVVKDSQGLRITLTGWEYIDAYLDPGERK